MLAQQSASFAEQYRLLWTANDFNISVVLSVRLVRALAYCNVVFSFGITVQYYLLNAFYTSSIWWMLWIVVYLLNALYNWLSWSFGHLGLSWKLGAINSHRHYYYYEGKKAPQNKTKTPPHQTKTKNTTTPKQTKQKTPPHQNNQNKKQHHQNKPKQKSDEPCVCSLRPAWAMYSGLKTLLSAGWIPCRNLQGFCLPGPDYRRPSATVSSR